MTGADIVRLPRILLRHEIERRAGRNQFFLLHAVLELAHHAMSMLHDPPAHVTLVDRLALLGVFLQMGDAGAPLPGLI